MILTKTKDWLIFSTVSYNRPLLKYVFVEGAQLTKESLSELEAPVKGHTLAELNTQTPLICKVSTRIFTQYTSH